MIKIVIISLISFNLYANDIQERVIDSIFKEVGEAFKKNGFIKRPEKKKQVTNEKLKKVQEKNKEEILKRYGQNGQKKSLSEILQENREKIKQRTLNEKIDDGPESFYSIDSEYQKAVEENRKKITQKTMGILEKWEKERKVFLKTLNKVKENLENTRIPKDIAINKQLTPMDKKVSNVYKIVKSSFDIPIRNQKYRPTCSSFAAIRNLEILLQQEDKNLDLSEQYFYYASKPNCQNRKCNIKGSHAYYGFHHSQNQKSFDIPLESHCPYKDYSVNGNETQIPLKSSCLKQGVVKVKNIERFNELDQVIDLLNKDHPVLISIKLSENFYKNKGLVLKNDYQGIRSNLDSHANGHAVILVGYVKLPQEFEKTEGKVCFVVANSWGEGWGVGGYSCLSEKWLIKFKRNSPMFTVKELALKSDYKQYL